MREGPDRRQRPRREDDRLMHYAHLTMDAALLAAYDDGEPLPLSVRSAVAAYRSAEAATLEVPA
jgi:hypothetical protein